MRTRGTRWRLCSSSTPPGCVLPVRCVKHWKPYDTRLPDVVISDVGMPQENGYARIRAIGGQGEGRNRRTIAIAMSGFAGREDKEAAISAGFDAHVAKPVKPDEL